MRWWCWRRRQRRGLSSRAAVANVVGRTRRSSPNICLPAAALPGSNPRCGCAYGARQTSAIVAVARVGFVPHQQTTAEHALLANAAANFSFFRTSELRAGARTSPLVSRPLSVTVVAPAPSHLPATRWHVGKSAHGGAPGCWRTDSYSNGDNFENDEHNEYSTEESTGIRRVRARAGPRSSRATARAHLRA
mmetsp:Transcript_45566/g.106526  ORF Transcript_45566/g.106526 Transcript_45566/m.106526 type:complete len:191 (-) Transcript_45566:209-781(-)